jgi:hypothetical protein
MKYKVLAKLGSKIANVLERYFSVTEIRSIVIGCVVKLLHPAFFHSQFIERGKRSMKGLS